jgi:DNA-binding CsgD family transcriptional regulator
MPAPVGDRRSRLPLVSASDVHVAWLSLDSTGHDFTLRDRRVLELLEPHFVTRVGAARLRRCFAAATAALEAGDESPAVLIAARDGEIEYASAAARRLLETYFGETDGRLPQPLAEQRNDGPPAYAAVKDGTGLLVHGAGADGALLLREEPNVALTRRQRDVLRCIAAGKTTVETARLLWVSEATVSKHLEHVYRKLGVTNRTAALAKLNGSLH